MKNTRLKIPELLSPAGSGEALDAAIEGGADAVYLGGVAMNARIHAGNFTPEALREAVLKAHAYGVRVYLTLNTLVGDRELSTFLDAAWDAACAGVDALIVADSGGAAAIRRAIPQMELHASTQMSGHNSEMAERLRSLGFSRMVAAREISEEQLALLTARSPIEIEAFVHGALCVCHSGQCLFSSIVGGRSGNRGECAQPCRLPYQGGYPLSLKDLSLAEHIPTLISLGVASLKIEGRMKPPEYVRDVTRIFRRLLDENRAASREEMRSLAEVFSRGGFTDGYFTGNVGRNMSGIRSEQDKENSRRAEPFTGLKRKVGLQMRAVFCKDAPVTLTVGDGTHTVTVAGEIPQPARTAPLSREDVIRSLSRTGGTPYRVEQAEAEVEDGLMLPVSRMNELRRRALEALGEATAPPERKRHPIEWKVPQGKAEAAWTARFYRPEQITPLAEKTFARRYLPLFRYAPGANGVVLPPVLFDGDREAADSACRKARGDGADWALVGNPGHLSLAQENGLIPTGDFRLNATNRESVALYESMGMRHILLSPELTLPQIRDIGGDTGVIVYGRLPLMLLERCISRELAGCDVCAENSVRLVDRRGVSFPVLREWRHRNLICNSLPTSMSDRGDVLRRSGAVNWHFLFTIESPREVDRVIEAFLNGTAIGPQVRRLRE